MGSTAGCTRRRAGHRRDRAQTRRRPPRWPHRARSPDRPPRRRGPHQPRDRRRALPQRPHRRVAPGQRVSEARRHLTPGAAPGAPPDPTPRRSRLARSPVQRDARGRHGQRGLGAPTDGEVGRSLELLALHGFVDAGGRAGRVLRMPLVDRDEAQLHLGDPGERPVRLAGRTGPTTVPRSEPASAARVPL